MMPLIQPGTLVIFFSFVFSLVLSILPLPEPWLFWKPEWATLVLIYWSMMLPHRVAVVSGWLLGLALDILYGTLLGQYALALAIVAFLSYRLQTRLRLYPLLQQSMIVMLLVALQQMLILWIKGISGDTAITYSYWLPSVTSTLIWPFVAVVLYKIQRFFYVH